MLKRVIVYGIAFGSLSASMLLINFLNQLYLHRNFVSAVPTLGNIFILGIGVFLLVKSFMVEDSETPITLGKTLFASLTMALIAALCNIVVYKHIQSNQPVQFEHFKNSQVQAIDAYIAKDTTLYTQTLKQQKRVTAIENLEEKLKVGTYASFEIQMYLSLSMIITLLVYIAKKKR